MPKISAGILLFRRRDGALEVLLAHPGGPLWAHKDLGAWTIPKGQAEDGEDLLDTARREFAEETGGVAAGVAHPLGTITQASGKVVHAWAIDGDFDPRLLRSNTFALEWPRRSGRWLDVPEVDRVAWFDLSEARRRINPAQAALLDRLRALVGGGGTPR